MKKRHHYIPKFYLEKFVDPSNDPYIWIYDKAESSIKKATAIDIAVQKDYYTFTSINGRRDSESYENKLAEIESYAARVFPKIINQENLDDEDRINFSAFLAFTMIRVPYYRDKIKSLAEMITKKNTQAVAKDPEVFASYIREFDMEEMVKNQEELRKTLENGNYDLRISSQISLEIMPHLALDMIPIFNKMSWYFLLATEDMNFVTSDNPVVHVNQMVDPNLSVNKGFAGSLLNRYTEISFPVSRNIMFLGTWGRLTEFHNYSELRHKYIKEMNRRTIFSAVRFVFASNYSLGLNEVVQKYKDTPLDKM